MSDVTIAYGTAHESPWHPIVVLVAYFAMLQGAIGVVDLLGLYRTIFLTNSNLLVQLAYLDTATTITTAGRLGAGICGLLVIWAAVPLLRYRARSRGRLLLIVTVAWVSRVVRELPTVRYELQYMRYWSDPGYRGMILEAFAAVLTTVLQAAVIPLLAWVVLTRPAIAARFRGVG